MMRGGCGGRWVGEVGSMLEACVSGGSRCCGVAESWSREIVELWNILRTRYNSNVNFDDSPGIV